jgi:hypothetical protein
MKNLKNNRFLLFLLILLLMIATPRINAVNKSNPAIYKEYTQLEIGDTLFDTPKAPRQKLLSSKIFLKGRVLKSPKLKNDEIVVYRIIITCCAADGIPLGILVKLPEKMELRDGEWIGVEGMIQLQPFNEKLKTIEPLTCMVSQEKTAPYFTATMAYKVKAPKDEYLYVQYNY